MSNKSILLCPPDHFQIRYEINPWMKTGTPIDKNQINDTYQQILSVYKSLGVKIHEISQDVSLPDMVYTANFGQVIGSSFIVSNFRYPQRQKESSLASAYFKKHFGLSILHLPPDIYFEGQGDLLTDGTRYFFGWGKRSHREALPYLQKWLDAQVVDFELIDPYYYHLDTALAPLSPDLALYNPRSFTREGINWITDTFGKAIPVSAEDNSILACNLVKMGKNILIAQGVSTGLRETLADHGYKLWEFDMSQYLKGGGSVKCISLEF